MIVNTKAFSGVAKFSVLLAYEAASSVNDPTKENTTEFRNVGASEIEKWCHIPMCNPLEMMWKELTVA
jgi:hypothetical protein